MKLSTLAAIAFAVAAVGALCGGACSTSPGAPLSPPAATQAQLVALESKAEIGFNALQSAYLSQEASWPPDTKAQAKAALGRMLTCTGTSPNFSCVGFLATARSAVATLDAATLQQQVGLVQNLVCVTLATVNKTDPGACPAAPPPATPPTSPPA